jgi:hypothetical protein
MKAKVSVAKAADGERFIPKGTDGAQAAVINATQEVMMAYGIGKFDVGYTPFGGVALYNPSLEDIKGHELKRPDVLNIILPETFKHLASVLFVHGVMRIELDEFTEEDIEAIKKTWNQI